MLRHAEGCADEGIRKKISNKVGIVNGELGRLSGLLDDFLSLARPRDIHPAAIDIEALVQQVVLLQAPAAHERGRICVTGSQDRFPGCMLTRRAFAKCW